MMMMMTMMMILRLDILVDPDILLAEKKYLKVFAVWYEPRSSSYNFSMSKPNSCLLNTLSTGSIEYTKCNSANGLRPPIKKSKK